MTEQFTVGQVIDHLEKEPFDTIFLIGAGVVTGPKGRSSAWEPVRTAIETALKAKVNEINPADPIAYLIFQLRLLSLNIQDTTRTPVSQSVHDLFNNRLSTYSEIKKQLKVAFEDATRDRSIWLDHELCDRLIEKYKSGRTAIITTNWDRLLDVHYYETKLYDVMHIHGSIDDPDSIYLPTEMSKEPYRHGLNYSRDINAQHSVCRTALGQHATKIVIIGNSLSLYDAETCVLLGDCHHNGERKKMQYVIVDPCHEPVARLRFLVGADVPIEHVNPKTASKSKRQKSLRSLFRLLKALGLKETSLGDPSLYGKISRFVNRLEE